MIKRRQVLITSGMLVLAGCTGVENGSDSEPPSSSLEDESSESPLQSEYPDAFYIDEEEKLILLDEPRGELNTFSLNITGTLLNASDREYGYVQITFELFDNTEAKIGTALANVNDLSPGQRWRYEAIGFDDNASSYKLGELTAF